jgi:hypothetical protein
MVYFYTKNFNLDTFWSDLEWKMLVYLVVIWHILWSFGIFCGHLAYFVVIWNILRPFCKVCGRLVF